MRKVILNLETPRICFVIARAIFKACKKTCLSQRQVIILAEINGHWLINEECKDWAIEKPDA